MNTLALSFLLLGIAGISEAALSKEYNHMVQMSPAYKFYWTINETRNQIFIAVEVNTTGWVALGFANEIGNMNGYDVGIGYVITTRNPNSAELKDCHTAGYTTPPVDTLQNLIVSGFSQVDGVTTLKYFRDLDTKDRLHDIVIKPGPMKVVWAYRNADNLNQKHDDKGWTEITLMSGAWLGITTMGCAALTILACLSALMARY